MATETMTWDRYCDYVDTLMASGRYGSRHEAGLAAQRRYPELVGITPASSPRRFEANAGATATPTRAGGNAQAQLDALADAIRRGNPALTKEQAATQALNEHPELYAQYLREHPAQTTSHT